MTQKNGKQAFQDKKKVKVVAIETCFMSNSLRLRGDKFAMYIYDNQVPSSVRVINEIDDSLNSYTFGDDRKEDIGNSLNSYEQISTIQDSMVGMTHNPTVQDPESNVFRFGDDVVKEKIELPHDDPNNKDRVNEEVLSILEAESVNEQHIEDENQVDVGQIVDDNTIEIQNVVKTEEPQKRQKRKYNRTKNDLNE